MTVDSQHRVADVYGLARVDRERRWTAIVDVTLVVAIALWVSVLALADGMSTAHWVVSVVLVAMVAHRVMILVERLRRRTPS